MTIRRVLCDFIDCHRQLVVTKQIMHIYKKISSLKIANQHEKGELLHRQHSKVICHKSNTTAAPCGAGNACHSGTPEFIPVVICFVLLDLLFSM